MISTVDIPVIRGQTISPIQPSFAKGELAPSLFGRVDLAAYRVGAARLRNMFVEYRGGVSNRPGTQALGRCKATFGQPPRFIPFTFSTTQAYVLEFGQQYMRVIMNGGYVLEPSFTVTNVTQASPGVVTTSAPHGFSNGDQVYIAGVLGMTQVNSTVGKQYLVAGKTATTFQLADLDGTLIDTSAYSAYTSGGTVARVFTLTTTYQWSDLPTLKYTQSADVLTLTHPAYPPANLTRTSHYSWTLTDITFQASVQVPTSVTVVNTGGGTGLDYYYVVTALTDDPAEESIASSSGSVANKGALDQTTGKNNTISWTAPATGPAPARYNIYKASPIANTLTAPTTFGLIGQSTGLSFVDANFAPDFTQTPPTHQNPFAAANDYPGVVTYFQQRKVFAATNNDPETFWMSRPGSFANMDTSDPVQDSDAITGTLASNQVNAILHLVAMQSGLIALSSGGAWQISGGSPGAVVSPGTITAQAQAFVGAHPHVPPLTINYDILFVQNKGSIVRDLAYNFYVNIYTGTDMSVLSSHLFEDHQIQEWAYAEEPHKIIWAVRDDGILLGFTYLKEQDVYAWTRHDTQGLFISVASITEGAAAFVGGAVTPTEDAVYFVVARRINGTWNYYAERMADRDLGANYELNIPGDPAKSWFLDCALQYPLVYPNATLTPGAATGTAVTFTTDNPVFTSAMVGNIIRIGGGIGTITAYNAADSVTVNIKQDIQAVIPDVPSGETAAPIPAAPGDWSCTAPVTTVTGLDHLAGMTVGVLADGNYIGTKTVSASGTITLTNAADVIVAGLLYTAQLQTMRLDIGDPNIQGKRKSISALNVIVNESRGWQYGSTFDDLVPHREGPPPGYGLPIPLFSNVPHVIMPSQFTVEGQVCIQQDVPLPLTVLGIVPEVQIGDTMK